MHLLKNASAFLLLTMLLFSCKSNTNLPADDSQQVVEDSTQNRDTTSVNKNVPETKASVSQTIESLVTDWNMAHNNKDINALKNLYADEVNLYGNVYSNQEVIEQKKQFFAKGAQTYQQILGGTDVIVHSPFVAKASFIKKITIGHTVKSYDAYLMFEKSGNSWKIVGENDEQTEEKVIETKSAPMRIEDISSCETAAEAIFRSSADVQKILREPNAKYKLEYTPGAPDNPNHRYWFWIYANAANSSSTETYARYQVDPITGQLYEFNAVEDKAMPVKSDVAMQQYIKKYCGAKP